MKKYVKSKLNKIYLYRYLAYRKHKHDVLKDPKKEANRVYKLIFNKEIDFENPKNLIEKIYWLQFKTDTSLWTKYADKYLVREYIKKCGYEDNLPNLYGKWDNANDIDFNELPDSFVLKTNNGCGTVMVVENKADLNIKSTRRKLNRWLSMPYGYGAAQLHYTKIEPKIIAEELLENNDKTILSLIDYKIWCFHGVPESVLVVHERSDKNHLLSLYDLEWNNISKNNLRANSKSYSGKDIPKPKSLDKMIEISKKLSKDFPQIRVDFYDVNGKAYFGEMTFTTGFGNYTKKYYDYLGSKIDLNLFAN